jgi:hypothetical protein
MSRWARTRISFGWGTDQVKSGIPDAPGAPGAMTGIGPATYGTAATVASSALDFAGPPITESPITAIRKSGTMTIGSRAPEPTWVVANSVAPSLMAYDRSMNTFFVSV